MNGQPAYMIGAGRFVFNTVIRLVAFFSRQVWELAVGQLLEPLASSAQQANSDSGHALANT
jgi:hypothetical protein